MALTESFNFKMEPGEHAAMAARAKEMGVSTSDLCRIYIRRGLSQDKLDMKIIDGLIREARMLYEERESHE